VKKASVQRRILTWYTLIFVALILLNLVVVSSISSSSIYTNASEVLVHETDETAGEMTIGPNGPTLDDEAEEDDSDPFPYYRDNVVFVVMKNGNVEYGSMPTAIQPIPPVTLFSIQRVKDDTGSQWLVYDVPVESGYVLRGMYSTSEANALFRDLLWLLAILSPILILISFVGGKTILKRLFRPINAVYQTAERIKDHEDYALRIPIGKADDEVARMAEMINRMLDQMQRAIRREKEFAANVSHELRTPLTVLRSQVEFLQTKATDEALQKDLSSIMAQIQGMERMVRQFLELARAKHIQKDDLETFDLVDLVESVAASMTPLMETKRIACTIEPPGFSTKILSYLPAHAQIWTNLISNAVKYNVEGGSIRVSFHRRDRHLGIDIADTGIGMTADTLAKAFDPFYRAEPSRSVEEGLGVGLSITKDLVALLEGSIVLESVPNRGTTVHLLFPESMNT
jgi:signal transduction histidine kinase